MATATQRASISHARRHSSVCRTLSRIFLASFQRLPTANPEIVLKVGSTVLSPGTYVWEMAAQNPVNPIVQVGDLEVGTWEVALAYTSTTAEIVSGFQVNIQFHDARLETLTLEQRMASGRNNRPSATNNLLFSFRLVVRPEDSPHPGAERLHLQHGLSG